MDCIKTVPDPDDEVHSASCNVIQLVDVKEEGQSLSINFPPAKDGNDDGSEVISIKREATDTQQEHEKSAVAITFPEIKADEEVHMASASPSYTRREDVRSEPSAVGFEPKTLHHLPTEMLFEILSHFGLEDLCLVIAKVCKKWRELAADIILKNKLSYSCGNRSNIDEIVEVLTNAPALHSLIICNRNDVADILKFLKHIHSVLMKLILKDCRLGEDGNCLVKYIVERCEHLEVLSLKGCYPLRPADYDLIPRLKNLSELNLSNCQGLNWVTVLPIVDSCQHLKKLSLDGVKPVDDDVAFNVTKKLGKQLTALVLEGSDITDDGYLSLKKCARLQELEISCCKNMTDRGLLEGIGSLQKLKSLCIDKGCNLTSQALSTFLHRPSMTSIVSLNLTLCAHLDDEGLKGIAERCIHLEELAVIGYCNVTDAGISTVVRHCSQLHVLNLTGQQKIRGEGWLTRVPLYLPHLRELHLYGCNYVPIEYLRELWAAAPGLIVFYPHGMKVLIERVLCESEDI